MCVVVELAESKPHWCHQDAAIRVPGDLSRAQMLSLARLILGDLGADQPAESTMEARCYCGAPVTVWDMPEAQPVVPRQRVHGATEAHRGA
jgi:hypothetical protein